MKLARFSTGISHKVYASLDDGRWVPLALIPGYADAVRLVDLVADDRRGELEEQVRSLAGQGVELDLGDAATVAQGPVWGAGLNYRKHSQDLLTEQPKSGPGSYLRPDGALIGNGGVIELPRQSERVTAEAELGLVIGRECKNVSRDEWLSVVAGVTAVLDMTAEDVIRENPRYIPWAKGFDTFCSVGPQLVTVDEISDFDTIQVSTVRNGEVIASAPVSDMLYDLGYLVEYFTAGRTIAPGTVICTGTPGAAVISAGDSVHAVVEGVGTLAHTVDQAP
ncbi:hypothetical protein BBK82_06905 [Lentzea guizhouensis]|uniref:Fumarylacetoacetase-like C-terminal domain-containing protein n=1 Tax=Lentzea guizhouensis TaxID=1586287 RepID=A0A1B2HDP7_9PSEU|nr:fumarylacetoacetate hydrolase family protein [Lentzea guizhouensis]ANZ35855.1 hypothetical protein BBK82_06905 [Lentzea guizhouensis]